MKFLADMGISPITVLFLRELGHNAIHLAEQALHRVSDPQVIDKARAENRIILTHDLDFGALMAAHKESLPSVIIFRLSDMRPENVNENMQLILQRHSQVLEEGAILSVTNRQVRIRRLPIR